MPKTILIQLVAEDKASAQIKKTEKAVSDLGKNTKTSMDTATKATQDTMGQLESLGNRFRYLSLVTGVFAAASIGMAKSFIDSAKEMEAATLRLGVFAESTGQSMSKAKDIALDLADTGLVSVAEASTSLANLLATGMNLDTAQTLLKRMLDTAVLSKESLTDTFGKALEKSTLGIRILQERQVDAIGINFRADQVWRQYGKTIGKTSAQMTTQEKQMAIVNYLMKETERFVGGADLATQTFGGSLSKLSASFERMKAALGETLIPLVGTLSDTLSWVTKKIGELAQGNAALSSSLISGIVLFGTMTAAVATLGALVPMLLRGFKDLSFAGLLAVATKGATALAWLLGISAAMGGLIYLILKVTGQWDKWRNSISSLTERIKAAINPMAQLGDTTAEADAKIAKQIKKLQENIKLATRDYLEDMGKWAKKHDETVKDLRSQIKELETDYKIATDKIRKSFTDTMSDLSLSHTRKTEDLQREIDEEVSKGIWADQTRIRELKLALKRENEDYALSTEEKAANRDENLASEEEKLNDRLVKLQADLNKELELEKNNAALVAWARTQPFLDELKERTRAYEERIAQYREELAEIQSTSSAGADALSKLTAAFSNVSGAANEPITKIQQLRDEAEKAKQKADSLGTAWGLAGLSIRTSIETYILPSLKTLATKLSETTAVKTVGGMQILPLQIAKLGIANIMNFFKSLLGFQYGGIIPGTPNQAVPIMAHGGETVLPYGTSPITININNPSVRDDQDIYRIADAVKQVISREQVLRHYQ